MTTMLGDVLAQLARLSDVDVRLETARDLCQKLCLPQWLTPLKKFLRKEDPWPTPREMPREHRFLTDWLDSSLSSRDAVLGEASRLVTGFPQETLGLVFDFLQKISGSNPDWLRWAKRFLEETNPWLVLTPTTYGHRITCPIEGAELFKDKPGDEALQVDQMQLLLVRPEVQNYSVVVGFPHKDSNWGQRAAIMVRHLGDQGRFSEKMWPVGVTVACAGTIWEVVVSRNVFGSVTAISQHIPVVRRGNEGFFLEFKGLNTYPPSDVRVVYCPNKLFWRGVPCDKRFW